MDVNKILTADFLDLLFEGKNKAYGAYDLRRTYNRRLSLALAGTILFCGLLLAGYGLANAKGKETGRQVSVRNLQLQNIQQPDRQEPPPPPPPPKPPPPPQVQITRFTPPRIVKDDQVKPDEKPPDLNTLDNTRIGSINQEGLRDMGIVAPPEEDNNRGIVAGPEKRRAENWDSTFTKVEIPSEYPGGPPAWRRYLNKNLHYPQDAVDNGIQGSVVVLFIVDREGNVSDVQAVSGPEELRGEAVQVIKKSGKWTPAIQNGRQVKSYKRQPIGFQINNF